MKFKFFSIFMMAVLGMTIISCDKDDLDSRSIF